MEPAVLKLIAARPDFRRRGFGVDTVMMSPANVKLALHFNQTFGDKLDLADTIGPPYDAFYVLAHAIAALGDKPITGSNLAAAIARLGPPGEPVEVGPAPIFDALRILREGKSIDLAGTTTSLDYDPATGDPTADLVILCAQPGKGSGKLEAKESGLRFDTHAGKLVGKLACP